MKHKISLQVKCPHCRKSLMDDEVILHGFPSIKLNIQTPEDRGIVNLCSVYECFDHVSSLKTKKDTVVDFSCPQCNKELLVKEECRLCDAPMVSFVLQSGGRVNFCSRHGCSNHYIAFDDLSTELAKFYEEFGD